MQDRFDSRTRGRRLRPLLARRADPDDVDEAPGWPSSRDVECAAHNTLHAADAGSRLVDEVVGMRIALPPIRVVEENPVLAYQQRQRPNALSSAGELRVHLPTKGELEAFPVELQRHIVDVATAALRRRLLPVLRLRRARKSRALLTASVAAKVPPVTAEQLQRVSIFSSWPAAAIDAAISKMNLRVFRQGEIAAHLHEPAHEMLFIAQGSVRVHNAHAKAQRRQKQGRVAPVNQQLYAPACLGEMSLLTDEPWPVFVRAAAPLCVWALSKAAFAAALESIPAHLVSSTVRAAFVRRNDAMRTNFPMTAATIRECAGLRRVSAEFAAAVVDRLQPFAVPRRHVLSTQGEPCEGLFFLRHGSVAVERGGERVATIVAPAVLCDAEMVHGSPGDATLVTASECDLYLLTKASFTVVTQQFPRDLDHMLDAARAQKREEVLANADYYIDIVRSMPIIGAAIPEYRLKHFLPLLRARSYRPLTSVCSTSEFCNRIIIPCKGRLRAETGGPKGAPAVIRTGAAIGWTCCVPHRWGSSVMALNATVEALEVAQIELMNFLDACGTLRAVVRETERLLFPRAFAGKALSIPPHVRFYPTSRSRWVNLNEPGFCTVHMSILAAEEEQERERRANLQIETLPQYRQLGHGVWVPNDP